MVWKAENIKKQLVFISFLYFWEARERCLSILGAVLDDVGSRVMFFEVFWTCWRQEGEQQGQDGDQEGQHGDQERQDEPT